MRSTPAATDSAEKSVTPSKSPSPVIRSELISAVRVGKVESSDASTSEKVTVALSCSFSSVRRRSMMRSLRRIGRRARATMMVPTKIVTPINVILTGLFIRSPLVAGLAFRAHVTHEEAQRCDHQCDPPAVVE